MSRREILNVVLAGVEHVEGDMFEHVPKGDAIFMKVSFALYFLAMWPFSLSFIYVTCVSIYI